GSLVYRPARLVGADPARRLSRPAPRPRRGRLLMRVFIAGSSGQLARALKTRAGRHGHVAEAFGRPQLDLAALGDLAAQIAGFEADIVINAAAYTAVDKAEAEPALALAVNRDGAAQLAAAA